MGLGDGARGKTGIKSAETIHFGTGEGYGSVRWAYNYSRASLTNCSSTRKDGKKVKSPACRMLWPLSTGKMG